MHTIYFAVSVVTVVIAIVSTVSLFILRRRASQTWTGTAAEFQRNYRLQLLVWVNLGVSELVTLYCAVSGPRSTALQICLFLACASAASALLGLLFQNMDTTDFAIDHKHGARE